VFHELVRHRLEVRSLYEVLPGDTMLNMYMDIDFVVESEFTVFWSSIWRYLTFVIRPRIDEVVSKGLASFLGVCGAHIHTVASVSVHENTSVGEDRNIPSKWSMHAVWKHEQLMLPNVKVAGDVRVKDVGVISVSVVTR